MRKVAVVGIGHTVFGNLSEFDLVDIMAFSSLNALDDAGIRENRKIIDQVFVGNMGGGVVNHQTGIASALVSRIDCEPAMAIACGLADVVLVTGGELMRTITGWKGTDFVATLLHPEVEYNYGLTLPAFGGMLTRLYMDRYGLTERELAMVAVKDHENGAKNPYAHVDTPCTLQAIHDSENAHVVNPYIAEPLRMYGVCPVSDGAASLLLCADDSPKMKYFTKK